MDSSFRLHHIGLLVADVVAASASLVERFGYLRETPIIQDPVQTAFVTFLRLPGADHWTELVAPNGPGSVLAEALRRRRGGPHHLCFQVDDLSQACDRLRDRSMLLITEPVPAVVFGGRHIAWLIDEAGLLVELVESGPGPLCLPIEPTESAHA